MQWCFQRLIFVLGITKLRSSHKIYQRQLSLLGIYGHKIIVRYVLENSLKSSKKEEDVAAARVQRGEGIGKDGDILDLVVVMALLDRAHNAC